MGAALSSVGVPSSNLLSAARLATTPGCVLVSYAHAHTQHGSLLEAAHDARHRFMSVEPFLQPDAPVPAPAFDATAPRERLLYGSVIGPAGYVKAVGVTRLSERTQVVLSTLSRAPKYPLVPLARWLGAPIKEETKMHQAALRTTTTALQPGATNLMVTLQHHAPSFTAEYSYSWDDTLWGARALRRWRTWANGSVLSLGGEVFASIADKAGGRTYHCSQTVSLGARCQMPYGAAHALGCAEATAGAATAAMSVNPVMGNMRMSYVARLDDRTVLGTSWEGNAFSMLSNWCIGAEHRLPYDLGEGGARLWHWYLRRRAARKHHAEPVDSKALAHRAGPVDLEALEHHAGPVDLEALEHHAGPVDLEALEHDAGPVDLKSLEHRAGPIDPEAQGHFGASLAAGDTVPPQPAARAWEPTPFAGTAPAAHAEPNDDVWPYSLARHEHGFVKGSIDASGYVALLLESRIRRVLVSVGVQTHLGSLAPVRCGIELLYLS